MRSTIAKRINKIVPDEIGKKYKLNEKDSMRRAKKRAYLTLNWKQRTLFNKLSKEVTD
jgi:hypothetical protein